MKNRNSIYKNLQGVSMGIMAACLALTACDKDKEFTPAMPEAKLINSITFDVSPTLPLAIGMDSMIVCKVEAPEELEDRTILWRSTDEAVARVSQLPAWRKVRRLSVPLLLSVLGLRLR